MFVLARVTSQTSTCLDSCRSESHLTVSRNAGSQLRGKSSRRNYPSKVSRSVEGERAQRVVLSYLCAPSSWNSTPSTLFYRVIVWAITLKYCPLFISPLVILVLRTIIIAHSLQQNLWTNTKTIMVFTSFLLVWLFFKKNEPIRLYRFWNILNDHHSKMG